MRSTDETKIRDSYSILWLFLESSSQHKSFKFSFQLLAIISNLIITITMLLKCIQNLRERPSFDIAHYKNRESVQNMRQLMASTPTLVYLSSVIDSGGSFRKQCIQLICAVSIDNRWRYGSLICITTLMIHVRVQYFTTVLYCLPSRDSAVVHYAHFYKHMMPLSCTLSIDYHSRYSSLICIMSLIIIPPPNEVGGGVYWIHLVRPSVRLSVRLSVDDMVSGA